MEAWDELAEDLINSLPVEERELERRSIQAPNASLAVGDQP